ncbi:MAG: diguanylate cyclase [Wenzhouxiangellaceae bacterium]|nr:diguanylate cyclase [Wenzhouxiangellaceae bacterium]
MTTQDSSSYPARRAPALLRSFQIACAMVAFSTGAAAFEGGNFQHYGIDQGLPQSQVRVIHQDPAGYLWVGTQGGLGRYNGREFSRFTSADGLAGNQIETIVTDSDGRQWVGTNAGLCRFESERFECNESPYLRGHFIQALAAGPDGLWVGTERGLVRLRQSDSTVVDTLFSEQSIRVLALGDHNTLFVGTDSGLSLLDTASSAVKAIDLVVGADPAVVSLLPRGDEVWVGTSAGLYLFAADGSVREMNPGDTALERTHVSGIVPGPDGGLMFGTYRGLYREDAGDDGGISRISGLEDEIIRSVFRDREGVVWIGQDGGLSKLAPTRFSGYDDSGGLLADFVRAIAQDSAGRLWLGTRVGVQVVPVRASGLALEQSVTLTRADGLPNDRIYAIEFAPEGGALLATNGGLVHWREGVGVVRTWTTADGLPSDQVRSLFCDAMGRIWIGTASGVAILERGELRTDLPAELAGTYVLAIRVDAQGWVWFATQDHGLLRLGPDGAVKSLHGTDGFSDQTLFDLAPAREGGMWVGSSGDGLFRIDSTGAVAAHFTERDGLANDFVWSVVVDDRGHVWAYTTRGLSRYDGERFVNYDKGDGLLHLEGGATGALKTRDGGLWFTSVGGLMRFDPRNRLGNSVPPPVLIEAVLVDGSPVTPGTRLPPDYSEITFEFAALTFQNENATRYRYRLADLHSDWNELDSYRPVTFAGLGHGDYEFQVQGANPSGVWSTEAARFAFGVAAPLWLRPWFLTLSVLALGALIASIWRYRVRGLQTHATRLEELVGERTHELEQANLRLVRFATTDPLTGLKNRRFLMDQIDHDIAHSLRRFRRDPALDQAAIGFLLLDLDHFKYINDNYGHQAGDTILKQVAEVLAGVARQSDYVIRWGGDEFLIVARHLAADAGCRLAERIIAALGDAKFTLGPDQQEYDCRCSIGVCCFPFTRNDPNRMNWEHVVEIADSAVYLAKRAGGGCWVEIAEARPVSILDAQEYLHEIRSNPEALEACGQIRILRGNAARNS